MAPIPTKEYSERSPQIMGILNITSDSFFDGNNYLKTQDALTQFNKMITEGADIIDIGAESSRPGSKSVEVSLECERISTLLNSLPSNHKTQISIDTSRSEVAYQALELGADMINDIYALRRDPALADLISEKNCKIVLMHMQNTPFDMQKSPNYNNILDDIAMFFEERISYAIKAGIKEENIILDPGIGFGKTLTHNLTIIKNLKFFKKIGFPILVGPSRKSFIGDILNVSPGDRIFGTAAAISVLVSQGADILRVHDVAPMKEICQVTSEILRIKEVA